MISIDYSEMERKFAIEQKMFEGELKLLEKLEDPSLDKDSIKEILGLVKQDTVYIENLGSSITEEELRKWFQGCGNIVSVRIPEDYQTRKKKGIAFITFDTELAAKQAKRHSGMVKYDRKIKVSIAEKKPEIERRIRKEVERKKWDEDEKEMIRKDFNRKRHKHSHNRRSDSEDSRKHHTKKRRSRSKERHRRKKESESESESESSNKKENSDSSYSSSLISENEKAAISKKQIKQAQKE